MCIRDSLNGVPWVSFQPVGQLTLLHVGDIFSINIGITPIVPADIGGTGSVIYYTSPNQSDLQGLEMISTSFTHTDRATAVSPAQLNNLCANLFRVDQQGADEGKIWISLEWANSILDGTARNVYVSITMSRTVLPSQDYTTLPPVPDAESGLRGITAPRAPRTLRF